MNTLHRDEKMLVNRGMAEIDWLHKRVIREATAVLSARIRQFRRNRYEHPGGTKSGAGQ